MAIFNSKLLVYQRVQERMSLAIKKVVGTNFMVSQGAVKTALMKK